MDRNMLLIAALQRIGTDILMSAGSSLAMSAADEDRELKLAIEKARTAISDLQRAIDAYGRADKEARS